MGPAVTSDQVQWNRGDVSVRADHLVLQSHSLRIWWCGWGRTVACSLWLQITWCNICSMKDMQDIILDHCLTDNLACNCICLIIFIIIYTLFQHNSTNARQCFRYCWICVDARLRTSIAYHRRSYSVIPTREKKKGFSYQDKMRCSQVADAKLT